ncbi:hypothetical protein QTP88_016866 [Uroleucon formosanum]
MIIRPWAVASPGLSSTSSQSIADSVEVYLHARTRTRRGETSRTSSIHLVNGLSASLLDRVVIASGRNIMRRDGVYNIQDGPDSPNQRRRFSRYTQCSVGTPAYLISYHREIHA